MIAGIGFREAAAVASVLDALDRAGAGHVRRLAVPQAKARHPAVLGLAALGYHILPIAPDVLAATPTLTASAASRAAHGSGSVAEACALAALAQAGWSGRLAGPRAISGDGMATAALALTGDPE